MYKFKELPNEEKPRERLRVYGSESLSNEELIMIILKSMFNVNIFSIFKEKS